MRILEALIGIFRLHIVLLGMLAKFLSNVTPLKKSWDALITVCHNVLINCMYPDCYSGF